MCKLWNCWPYKFRKKNKTTSVVNNNEYVAVDSTNKHEDNNKPESVDNDSTESVPDNNPESADSDNIPENCCICMEPLASSPKMQLECKHFMHTSCGVTWITKNNECPLCRGSAINEKKEPSPKVVERVVYRDREVERIVYRDRVVNHPVDSGPVIYCKPLSGLGNSVSRRSNGYCTATSAYNGGGTITKSTWW